VGKPFVYKSTVSLKAPVGNEVRKEMEGQMINYLDDSIKISTKSVLGFQRQINPPIFDSANIDRSKSFIKNYLNSLGYYAATFDTIKVKYDTVLVKQYKFSKFLFFNVHSSTKHTGYRTNIAFNINAGQQIKFDSIWYDLKVPELETLANESKDKALMRKGEGYSKQVVGQELDRLVSLYRSKGYFKMTRASLAAEFDSINQALISFDIDPFLLLQQAQERKKNPTVDFRILQRPGADTTAFLKYNLGKLTIFPEARIDEDKSQLMADSTLLSFYSSGGITLRYNQGLFANRTVRRFNTMVPGLLYNEEQYYKTVNAFSQVGSWQQVDVKANTYIDSTDSIPKVDINLFLTPAKKFSFKTDFEGSQNIGRNAVDVLTGSFFGVSVVGNLLNRNFGRSAIQQNMNLRGGVEISSKSSGIGNSIFQSLLLSAGTTFSIPRLWPPLKWLVKKPDVSRTFLNIGGGYNDRKDFYTLTNLNIALGFEWKKRNQIWTVKIPNVEFVNLKKSDSLVKLIAQNPNLSYSFNQGLVLGISGGWQWDISYRKRPNQNTYVRVNVEESGLLTGGFIKNTLRFWKADMDVRHIIVFAKHKWAFRATGGYGRNYSSGKETLPFFRQFIAGGPNSMRAWRLRQLGLGNSFAQDTASFKDRLGDIYMELNGEYRFNITKLIGYPIEGALFTDIGNVWNRFSQNPLKPDDGVFALKYLARDLAIAAGFGIRWDFSYLRVRLDYAYKIKDPVRGGNGWLRQLEFKTPNSYGNQENKNWAIQFGIDYPF
jgi:outer membrane protein insertion porin family